MTKHIYHVSLGVLLAATLVCAALFWPQGTRVGAQTAQVNTTTSAVMTATDTSVALTSDTGVSAGTYLYIDGELMQARSEQGTSARWNVRRGLADGMSPAVRHTSGTRVDVMATGGAGESFYTYDIISGSACVSSEYTYLPRINTKTGQIADCEGGYWMVRRDDQVKVRDFTVRDSFDQGYFIHQDDMTAKSVSDDEDNVVYGSPLGIIEYREELGKTASSWLIADGLLDISADDGATDAEGIEAIFGVAEGTDMGVLVAGTQGGCVAASLTINSIVASTDFLVLGWRQNEAFVDNATPASYTLYNLVGIYNSEDGSIFSIETGATSDDSAVNWATTETRALKVCISSAGVPSAFYSAAYTHSQTRTDRPTYTQIPNVSNGTTLTAGTQLVPFFTMLYGNDTTNSDIRVNWVELTRFP